MVKETLDLIVKGGAATAGPPLGPKLGPTGINIGEVVKKINEKTAAMKGMDIPVKLTFDSATKEFDVEVGTPSTTVLLKKELGIEKAAMPEEERKAGRKIADVKISQALKVAKIKLGTTLSKDLKAMLKEVVGACTSMQGITVEGKLPKEIIAEITAGKWDGEIK